MKKAMILELLEGVERRNPYPLDIFSDIELREAFIVPEGKRERLFAKFGRMVWSQCVATMRRDFIEEMEIIEGKT